MCFFNFWLDVIGRVWIFGPYVYMSVVVVMELLRLSMKKNDTYICHLIWKPNKQFLYEILWQIMTRKEWHEILLWHEMKFVRAFYVERHSNKFGCILFDYQNAPACHTKKVVYPAVFRVMFVRENTMLQYSTQTQYCREGPS